MQSILWEQDFACIHRRMLLMASVGGGLWGDELEGESSLSSLTGELGGLEAPWVDSAPEVEECGNVGVAVGGVVAGGDGGRVDGIEGVAGEDTGVCRFGGDGDSGASAEATRPEIAGQLVQGLCKLQSAWASWRWWSSVVEARVAREARGRGEARVRGAGLVKVVKVVERWQSSWVFHAMSGSRLWWWGSRAGVCGVGSRGGGRGRGRRGGERRRGCG